MTNIKISVSYRKKIETINKSLKEWRISIMMLVLSLFCRPIVKNL